MTVTCDGCGARGDAGFLTIGDPLQTYCPSCLPAAFAEMQRTAPAVKTTRPRYRETRCDNCEKVRKDCIWVERFTTHYVLCGDCRSYWRHCGHHLTNVDPDFPQVVA